MMNIREYFDKMMTEALTDEEMDEVIELENTMFHCMEDDELDFESWAHENGIDLNARDALTGEFVLTLWCWDMCGD